jgi:hypothetical protein
MDVVIYFGSRNNLEDQERHPSQFHDYEELARDLTENDLEQHYAALPAWVVDELSLPDGLSDERLCDHIFARMNHYETNPLSIEFWMSRVSEGECARKGQDWVVENQAHTSMSVGDMVEITAEGERRLMYCDSFQWRPVDLTD